MSLIVSALEKKYATVTAVNKLSFEVNPGEIFALLGPNGAGKSSLVKMLVGFTLPDSGSIALTDGQSTYKTIPSHLLGYLPEDRGLYPEKSVIKNLAFFATLHGVSPQDFKERCDYWLEKFNLSDRGDEPLKSLSKGNQQKVQLITAVLHKPKWVILDEPFSGLDPINQELVVKFLAELKHQGMTVILSAHQMAMVEKLADRVLLLNQGQSVIYGDLEQILAANQASVIQTRFSGQNVLQNKAEDLNQLKHTYDVEEVKSNQIVITLTESQSLNQLIPLLLNIGEIAELKNQAQSLHSLYLNAVTDHNSKNVNDNSISPVTQQGGE